MAFLAAPAPRPGLARAARARVCARRAVPRAAAGRPPPPDQPVSGEEPSATGRRLVRDDPAYYAEAYPGEAGGVEVGTGLGPKPTGRTETGEKRVTKAAEAQGSMGFADAWASQNRDRGGSRFDVWFWIGLLFIAVPPGIIVIAILTGAIPGFVDY